MNLICVYQTYSHILLPSLIQAEIQKLEEEKELVQTTLEATRSALVAEQRKLNSMEKEMKTLKKFNDEYEREKIVLSEQLKKLGKVKDANQKLMQQVKEYEVKVHKMELTNSTKEKVSFYRITNPFIHPSIHLYIHQFIYPFIHLTGI